MIGVPCQGGSPDATDSNAPRYDDEPSALVFEILNEPNGRLTPELWNRYLREALAIIRTGSSPRTSSSYDIDADRWVEPILKALVP